MKQPMPRKWRENPIVYLEEIWDIQSASAAKIPDQSEGMIPKIIDLDPKDYFLYKCPEIIMLT
jgi:hypothetical protein